MKKQKAMTAQQKLPLLIAALLIPMMLLQGCSSNPQQDVATTSLRNLPAEAALSLTETVDPMGPEGALEDIYADVTVRGMEEADETVLFEKFGISEELYDEFYVHYSSGRYGLADVFMLSPETGQDEALREALEQVKLNRTMEFKNYDIYNALEYAEDGLIFESNGYLVLVMMENAEDARTLIEAHLAE